jgi:hypothetical protein
MFKTPRNFIFIVSLFLLVFILLLIFLGKFYLPKKGEKITLPKEEALFPKPTLPEEVSSKEPPSFSGKVEEKGNDFIIVSKGKDEKIKVILDSQTQVFKIIYPKDAGQKFTTKRVQISPDEIKKGDTIFVKTTQKGKVISHVEYIEVL